MRILPIFLLTLFSLALTGCNAKVKTVDSCGDGVLDPGEECDGAASSAGNCEDLGYYQQTGTLVCRADCTLNTSVCLSRCGDDVIQTAFGEQCEGDDLSAETCETLGLGAGNLGCNASCRYDTSACENDLECGDGVIIGRFEDCEGENLEGQTCASLGYYGGDLACDPYTCTFVLGGCENFGRCGDNAIQETYAEECDGSQLGGATCASLGYYGGQLTCDTACRFDRADCATFGICGDDQIQSAHGEVCEAGQLGDATCESLGWYGGALACGADCATLDVSGCETVGRCGDGLIQSAWGEFCDGANLGGVTCRDADFFSGSPTCTGICSLDFTPCVNAIGVSTGGYHTCATLADGTVRCWGFNYNGQLGDGTTTERHSPQAINGLTDVVEVATGGSHTCARHTDGTVTCWGYNGRGQLGVGTTTETHTPVVVIGLSGARQLALGDSHSCVALADGTARCWGNNAGGRIGDGTTDDRLIPVLVSGLAGVSSLTAGEQHTCAQLTDGTARCWGTGLYGRLGDGTGTNRLTPVVVPGLDAVVGLGAGDAHTCAVLADGTVRCWGYNYFGQVGDGTTTNRLSPVAVTGLVGVSAVAAGQYFTCALLSNGTVRCWGYGDQGQLGDGLGDNSLQPVTVYNLGDANKLSCGLAHNCVLRATGHLACWGDNTNGPLGDGTIHSAMFPVAVRP